MKKASAKPAKETPKQEDEEKAEEKEEELGFPLHISGLWVGKHKFRRVVDTYK